jgi:hemolysin activation/secretion protein
VFYQICQRRWLILSVILTIVGSAVKAVAQEDVDISRSDLETTREIERISNSQFSTDQKYLSQLPNPITPRTPEQPTPTLPNDSQEAPLQTLPTRPTPEIRPDIPGTIRVERFEFVGNTVFSNEKLAEVTKPFTAKPITFAELLQAEAAVTKQYTDAGYINSGAVIPADQSLVPSGAVVKIQIIEGRVEEIRVTGTRRLNPGYVRSRLSLATSPLNRNQLLEALQLLQLDPLIKTISAQLSAGSRPEVSVLEVRVQEADSFKTDFFADNSRTPSVGSFERGVRINQGNLLGFGDRFDFTYTNTDGSNSFDLSYTVPINPRNGTIKFAAGLDDSKVVESPFDRIDITGNSRYYELSFRQPIVQTPTQELALGLTASRQESATKLLGEDYPLSAGADENGKTRISALRFFQEWTQRSPQEIFAVRSQFSLGLDVLDATINDEPPDSRFFAWQGQAQYVRLLAPDTLLLLRSDAQLSTRALVPLEQFGLGGPLSVRGYGQNGLLTDNAVFASAEVRLPILRSQKLKGLLQLTPFVDFGVGWNSSGEAVEGNNTLLGIGLGLHWQMGNQFTARLDWGIPLIEINTGEKKTLQEEGLYFSVTYSPF